MAYYHWAADAVTLRQMSYPQIGQSKPNGLWFDVNGHWRRWCEAVQFRLENLRYRHTVTIRDRSRILFLKNGREIDAFTREYGRNVSGRIQLLQGPEGSESFERSYGSDLFAEIQRQFSNYILWSEVAEKHSGIVVSP
jgi:hypothetical protein